MVLLLLTWGNDTGGQLVNVGGDYWEVTLALPADSAIAYKFFANASGDGTGDGWEANLNTGNGNRGLTTTTSDTVLPVKFFNKIDGGGEDDLPFTPSDSMDVWFRVNVHRLIQYSTFDPATQVMGIRGGTPTWTGETLSCWNRKHPTRAVSLPTHLTTSGPDR